MSYPKTTEQRLVQLYGYKVEDLTRLFLESKKNKDKYQELLNKLDKFHADKIYTEMMNENTFIH